MVSPDQFFMETKMNPPSGYSHGKTWLSANNSRESGMKRILVIGCGGAGKSTLAKQLGETLSLPVHHLDKLWWKPGWVEESVERFDAELAKILKQDRWIIDGNYNRTLPERLKYADTVIFLDYSPWICLMRALKRIFRWHGRVRPDMGAGCPERLDLEFLRYIWTYNRRMRPRTEESLSGFSGRIIRLKHPGSLTEPRNLFNAPL